MSTPTVTANGQFTLRKEILQHLGVQPGDKIAVDTLPDGRIVVRAARTRPDFGCFQFFEAFRNTSYRLKT